MTKYGVVGTGYFGAELARFMSKVEGAKITAIYDPVNAAPIAKELNCVATATMEALCSHPDVDCVIIASPNYLHKAPVIAAAKAGKHVFCEKPIALNYQDCKDMVDACKEAGVTFMAGHVKRGELFKIDLQLIQDNQKRHNGELFKIKFAVV